MTCYNKPEFCNVKWKNNWEVKKERKKREGEVAKETREDQEHIASSEQEGVFSEEREFHVKYCLEIK